MNARTFAATVRRVLAQLAADRRTLGLIMVVPAALLTLLYFVYYDYPHGEQLFNRIAVAMMAILPMLVMFLVTSVTMLRERGSGTLERLWTTPLHRADLLLGYAAAFTATAVGQSLLLCAVAAWCLGVQITAPWAWVILTALVDGFLGVALGLFVSAFARTEFQAVQFFPVIIGPQIFLCGLLVARDQLPRVLELCSNVLPMSWAVDAVGELSTSTAPTTAFAADLGLVAGVGVAILAVAALTVPRRVR
ncbi:MULTISPECIES: ABC transporter permease [unclassified Actinomyces]|uniref:ABC transporter permease n=1 Tax=unclassified Actinomyces TaxID=2609248 RepID=UPI000D59FF40|nr:MULTISPECIES: ABC transporter permease [unclassified Actinomyces]RAX21646.1 ABC transporter permease [Actinomyces sp. Z5]RAX21814.1 ABC transporter permease [Actinomyces sp. Z3]